ncbi:ATP-binding protein, partial [Streptomyces anulatus]|nr:ATP-binding protein [Streptomyces anulatus]
MTAVTDEDQDNGDGTPKADRRADGRWDDGLIARRAAAGEAREAGETAPRAPAEDEAEPQVEAYVPSGGPLPPRLDALRELVGLSRARLDRDTLAEAGRVLDEAA